MKFKVGDKIKLVDYEYSSENGRTGTIIKVYEASVKFPYRVRISDKFSPPVKESEIDFHRKIGEQLLLFEL